MGAKKLKMETFIIEGMTCVACARRVKQIAQKTKNVNSAEVNLASERLYLEHNGADLGALFLSVEKAGFRLKKLAINKIFNYSGFKDYSLENIKDVMLKEGAESVEIDETSISLTYVPSEISALAFIEKAKEMGAVLTPAKTQDARSKEKEQATLVMKRRLFISVFFTVPLFIISMGPMALKALGVHLPHNIDPMNFPAANAILQLLLVAPVIAANISVYNRGFAALWAKRPNMDTLIAKGTAAAFFYSLYLTFANLFLGGVYEPYYEITGVILSLILLGKYFETRQRGKTSEAINRLMNLAPQTANIIRNNKEVLIFADEAQTGDIVLVKPGEAFPTDGIIIEGRAVVDESMLTGESMPLEKEIGEEVSAATIMQNGFCKYRATKVGDETALAQIIKLVENAQNSKAPIADLADKICEFFVPAIITLAILGGVYWFFLGGESLWFALRISISVLVIACPCALGLATPLSIMVGTGKAANSGVLIKNGEALQKLSAVNLIFLDKTGTITEGKPKVKKIISNFNNEIYLLAVAAAVERNSEHPLAKAIVEHAENVKAPEFIAQDFKYTIGMGVEAFVDYKKILAGNKKLMEANNINLDLIDLKTEAQTCVYIAQDGVFLGVIALGDAIKLTSKAAINRLLKLGLKIITLTGDNLKVAEAVSKEVGIKEWFAEVMPADKARYAQEYKEKGYITAMVGDGINDAPVLATADVGIAIGAGTDAAIESAQIILMQNDLTGIANAIETSRKVMRNIRQNLFWAFIYNILGVPVALGAAYAFGGPLLNPMIAAFAMGASSICVTINALRLRK